MKTKFSRIGKQSISVVLSVLMILSTMVVGSSVTVDTAAIDDLSAVDVVDDAAAADDYSSEEIKNQADDANDITDNNDSQLDDNESIQSNDVNVEVTTETNSKKKAEKTVPNSSGASYTFYFLRPVSNWSSKIYIHAWDSTKALTTWPNKATHPNELMSVDEATGLYYYTFSSLPTGIKIVDKNGTATSDITSITNNGVYTKDGTSGVVYSTVLGIINNSISNRVYFVKPSGWGTPKAYAWYSLAGNCYNASFPGETMTQLSGDIYYCDLSRAYDGILFTDKATADASGNQSANQTLSYDSSGALEKNRYTYSTNSWDSYTPTSTEDWYIVGRFSANGNTTSGNTNWDPSSDKFPLTPDETTAGLYKYETNATIADLSEQLSNQPMNFGFRKKSSDGTWENIIYGPYAYGSGNGNIDLIADNANKSYDLETSSYYDNNGIHFTNQFHFNDSDATTKNVVLYLDTNGTKPVFYFKLVDIPTDTNSYEYLRDNPTTTSKRVFLTYKDSFTAWSKSTAPWFHGFYTNGSTDTPTTDQWTDRPQMTKVTNSESYGYKYLYYIDVPLNTTKFVITGVSGKDISANQQTMDRELGSGNPVLITLYSNNQWNDGSNKDKRCDLDCTSFDMGTSSDRITIFAKNGTIRHSNTGEEYDKFSRMAVTKIYKGTTEGSAYTSKNTSLSLAEVMAVEKGTQVKIETTIDKSFTGSTDGYYVAAFIVNGETYSVDKTTKNSDNSVTYTFNYTVPEDSTSEQFKNGYVEITPVYFTNSSDYVTFYVEDFTGQVKSNWKDTIACYAWYSQMSSDDTLAYNSIKKPALGGYPGQPMIKQGDRYYIQVPKSIKETNYSIQGITLNNYIWDDIHALTLGYSDETAQIEHNLQTYDYDDFVALQETAANGYKGAETIICQFKYRTTKDNFDNVTDSNGKLLGGFVESTRSNSENGYIAKLGAGTPDTNSTYETLNVSEYENGNGWDVLTDVNNKPVDIYDNLLNSANTDTTFDTISLVKSYNGRKVHIVSDGYEFVEWYIGKYATLWYVYDENNKFVGALPPSAFLYNVGKNETLNKDNVPTNFLKYSKKAFVADSENTASVPKNLTEKNALRKQYWETFVDIYNAGVYGKPTLITYEQTRWGGDNWAERNDARWLYSVPYVITSNVYIEYGTLNEDGSFDNDTKVRDTYKTDKDGNATNEGSNTGIQAYYTNKKSTDDSGNDIGYNLYGKTAVTGDDNVMSSGTENFNFTVSDNGFTIHDDDTNTDKHYTFIGWYVEKTDEDGNKTYEPVNSGSKLYNEDGSYVMLTDSVFVARYVESDILTVSHKLLSSDTETTKPTTHNGTGEPLVTVKVTTPNGEAVIAENSTRDVNINDIQYYYRQYNSASDDDKAKFKLEITLSTTRDEETSVYGVYRKDANSTSTTYYRSGLFSTTEDTENSSATADDSLNTNGTNNPTDSGAAVVYTYTFDKLFNEDGSLNTNILAYRTDLAKPQTVNLEFKYYDRLLKNNTTATIDTEATTLHYTLTDITCYDDLENKIQSVISNPKTMSAEGVYAGAIDNLIDKYAVWASLKEAADEESGYGHWEYGKIDATYSTYDYENIKLYHTNAYSAPQTSGEKWVTYYKGSGDSKVEIDGIDETNEYKMTVSEVGTVVVWAFNTPKEYTLDVYTAGKINDDRTQEGNFTGDTKLSSTPVKGSGDDTLYKFDVDDPKDFSGYYNQRVGGQDKYGASANKSDTAVDYLLKYFGKEGSVGNDGDIAYTGEVVDAPETAHISGDDTTEYQFDGWYTIGDDGEYYKVSSDRIYGNRITTSMDLYALYKKSPVTLTNKPIVSVTNNGVDIYVDETTDKDGNVISQDQWARLNTQLNVSYDGATQDNDKKIKRVAVIYVALQSQDFDNDGNIKSANIDKITQWIENHKSSLTVADDGSGTVRKAGKVSFADNTEREIVIMDRFNVGSSDTDKTYLSLTSKNRVQFVLPMNYKYYAADSEGNPGAYQYMIAFGAIQYDSDGNDTVSDSDWIISDNYVSFVHD